MNKMKNRFLTTLLISLVSFVAVVGCSKPEPDPQPNNDEYYVKYVFSCQVIQYGKSYATPYSVTFTNSSLEEQIREYKSLEKEEIICGPFKHNNKVDISLSHNYYDNVGGSSHVQSTIDVYVSKNNSPFALKKTDSSSSQKPYTTSLEYTIDY